MNTFVGSIDTDMAIGSILSNFESAWVMNTIRDSLNMRFRPFAQPMPNFVDILERQFNTLNNGAPDYVDKVNETRTETYKEIITTISEYYHLAFTASFEELSPQRLYSIAHTMYDIFIARFTDYMIDFYIRYIINNMDSIYAYLSADETVKKVKDKDIPVKSYIDPRFQLIHANMNKIILNMVSYDISFETLLSYFADPYTCSELLSVLEDTGDIYKNFYASYLQDQRYMAQLLTCIKLKLQAKTQEAYNIIPNTVL